MAGVKQEDAFQAAAAFQNFFKNPAAAAAMFPNALGLPATIPPNLAGPSTSSNSVSLTGLNDDAVQLPSRHSSSSTHRVSSAALRPHSEDNSISAADVGGSSKRAKVEQPEEGELEIDVQNDDATSSAAPSHTNGRNSHPRGSSRSHHQKDDRDSTQSATSSRDSATPRSKRQVFFCESTTFIL
jgi:hypothetical protein